MKEAFETIKVNVEKESQGVRIDKFLASFLDDFSRNSVLRLIEEGSVLVNGASSKASYKIKEGDEISVSIAPPKDLEILPRDIPLEIVYEDSDLIVVNKEKGMVVHPAAGHYEDTLVNALLYYCKDLSGINGIFRPGIVHRIDKDTSGLLVCAKNDFAHSSLADQLKNHSITRIYEAICVGRFREELGRVEGPIGRCPNDRKKMAINYKNGKAAVTNYKVLMQYNGFAHVELCLETGRTHQIRVHMKEIGHPLVGDMVYGNKACEFKLNGKKIEGQLLHAKVLGFMHPRSGKYLEFKSELPKEFKKTLEKLKVES